MGGDANVLHWTLMLEPKEAAHPACSVTQEAQTSWPLYMMNALFGPVTSFLSERQSRPR